MISSIKRLFLLIKSTVTFDDVTITVKPTKTFDKGLEVICRFRAVGHFYRRYGDCIDEGLFLPTFVETTLKDDAREDPPITKDALDILGIVSAMDYEVLKDLPQKIATIIKEELSKK
ncbi:MAG TPA: hypothetical protein O0W91_03980, partial [Methanocorpusculum sp.]|nr:hypothetical protein [Methanocorpusculum sp.]